VHNPDIKQTTVILVGPFPKNSSNIGGVSIWDLQIVRELVRRHIDIAVVPWYGSAPGNANAKIDLITERSLRFWRYFLTYFFLKFHVIASFIMRKYLTSIKDIYRMVRLFVYLKGVVGQLDKSRQYIVLASHVGFRSLFALMLKQQLERANCVIDVHGAGILEFAVTHRNLVHFLLDSADKVFVRSNYIKQECLKKGGQSEKIYIVPCGIEVSTEGEIPKKKNIVAFCGALVARKDPLTLLTAIPLVKQQLQEDIKFLFIGSGELKNMMLDFINKNSLGDCAQLLGSLPNEEVTRLLKLSKILVLPSIREPFGIVLLEAMSCFTPCIVTDVGGMPEIVNSEVGLVVEPGNPQAIAEAIVRLLKDEKLWEEKARMAYRRSLQYDMKKIGDLLVKSLDLNDN